MNKFCPIMTAGAISNSHMIALQSDHIANKLALIECSPDCGVWDETEHRCGLITQPPPKPNLGPG